MSLNAKNILCMLFNAKFVAATLIIVTSLLLTVIAPKSTIAQSDNGIRLSMSPLPINLSVKPGETTTTTIRVRNSGSQNETLQAGLLKFSADRTTGDPILLDRQDGDNYFDWVQFSPSRLELVPNEWGEVAMTISVPDTAAFGYYYAVTFGRADEVESQRGQATLQGAAATLVLLEVDVPGAKRELEIENFKTAKDWYEFLPVTFESRIRNRGNVHAIPFGNIFIKQADKTIDTVAFNSAKGSILPDSPRMYDVDWSNGFPVYEVEAVDDQVKLDENGQPIQDLKWDFAKTDQFRFGKYTAQLVLAYDNGERDVPLTATVDFWIIPWRIILAVIFIITIFTFGLTMIMRGVWRGVKPEDDDYV